jgi:hypothetical protein
MGWFLPNVATVIAVIVASSVAIFAAELFSEVDIVRFVSILAPIVVQLVVGLNLVTSVFGFVTATLLAIIRLSTVVASLQLVRLSISFLLLLTLLLSNPVNLLGTETVILWIEQNPNRQL